MSVNTTGGQMKHMSSFVAVKAPEGVKVARIHLRVQSKEKPDWRCAGQHGGGSLDEGRPLDFIQEFHFYSSINIIYIYILYNVHI